MELWWIFPVSIVFSTIAISSGVSGALFFSPFFMLVVGLSPAQAVGAGLLTEVFGMGNGLRLYVGQRVVDYAWARWLLAGAVPSVIVGALVAHRLSDGALKLIFGGGLLVLAVFLFRNPTQPEHDTKAPSDTIEGDVTVIDASDGTRYTYPTCSRGPGVALAVVGGALTGMISAGLPELSTTQLIIRCKIAPRVAVATAVFTLAITALAGAAVHALSSAPARDVVQWSIPGVLVGSFFGSRVGRHLPAALMEKTLAVVFAGVGLLVISLQLVS
jgi:uncharacterized protein